VHSMAGVHEELGAERACFFMGKRHSGMASCTWIPRGTMARRLVNQRKQAFVRNCKHSV